MEADTLSVVAVGQSTLEDGYLVVGLAREVADADIVELLCECVGGGGGDQQTSSVKLAYR